MVGTKWGASHHEHVRVPKCLCERTETDDAGWCVERHPCRMETCGTEEPDEGNLHVRICGGAGREIAGSTWTVHTVLLELQPPRPHGPKDLFLSQAKLLPGRLVAQRGSLLSPYRIQALILVISVVVSLSSFCGPRSASSSP